MLSWRAYLGEAAQAKLCVLLATLRFPLHLRQQKLRPVALLGRAVLEELPLSPGGVAPSLRLLRCGSQNATPTRHRGRSRLIFTRLTHTTTTDVLSVRKEGYAGAELRPRSRPQRWSLFEAVECARRALEWRVVQASQGCAALPPRAARVRARVALTFARPPAEPRPKASCLHVSSGRHGTSLRSAGGFEGCRPLQVAELTRHFRPTLQRPAALPPTRTRPSSVRADGRHHEIHFPSHMRPHPVCLRDAVAFFMKNTKLSTHAALRSTRLRPAPFACAMRSWILERSVSSES